MPPDFDAAGPSFAADFGLLDLAEVEAVFEFDPFFAVGLLLESGFDPEFALGLELELVFEAVVDFAEPFPCFFAVVEGFGVGFLTAFEELPVSCVVVWLKTGINKKQEINTAAKYLISTQPHYQKTNCRPPF